MKQSLFLLSAGIFGAIVTSGSDEVDEDCGYGVQYDTPYALNTCFGYMYNNSGSSYAYLCNEDGTNITTYYFEDTVYCDNTAYGSYDSTNEFSYFQCNTGEENLCVVNTINVYGDVWDGFNTSQLLEDYYVDKYSHIECDYLEVNISESDYNISIDPACYNYSDWYYGYDGNWTWGYMYNGSGDCPENYTYYFQGLGWDLKMGYYYEPFNCSNTSYVSSGGDCEWWEIVNNSNFDMSMFYITYDAIVIGECDGWNTYECDEDGGLIQYSWNWYNNCSGNHSYSYNYSDSCSYSDEQLNFMIYQSCNYTSDMDDMYTTTVVDDNDDDDVNTTMSMSNNNDSSSSSYGTTGNDTSGSGDVVDDDDDSANMYGQSMIGMMMMIVVAVVCVFVL